MIQTKLHRQLNCSTSCLFVAEKDFSNSDLFNFLYLSYSGKYPNMEMRLNLAQLLKISVHIYALKPSWEICCFNCISTMKAKEHFRIQ